ncbi:hypothetical protein DIPPA_05485 [Diplonema papillatum]|nr:hypothetical protein DIPPA_05485 [Diplonema papillatum]
MAALLDASASDSAVPSCFWSFATSLCSDAATALCCAESARGSDGSRAGGAAPLASGKRRGGVVDGFSLCSSSEKRAFAASESCCTSAWARATSFASSSFGRCTTPSSARRIDAIFEKMRSASCFAVNTRSSLLSSCARRAYASALCCSFATLSARASLYTSSLCSRFLLSAFARSSEYAARRLFSSCSKETTVFLWSATARSRESARFVASFSFRLRASISLLATGAAASWCRERSAFARSSEYAARRLCSSCSKETTVFLWSATSRPRASARFVASFNF